jgi:hypothetical protein
MAKPVPPNERTSDLPPEVVELRRQVDMLPRASRNRLVPLCERVAHLVYLQAGLLRVAQDAIDRLHLDNRYLVFDVEATRRERDALRQELENLEGE